MNRSIARKLVHIFFGAGALLLNWLTPWQAAAVAGAALLFNVLVLPHVGGRRIARTDRGYDLGIVLYPLAVGLLILAFPHRLAVAGVVWIILAVGDGFATLVGAHIRGPKLPWHPDKSVLGSLAFLVTAIPAAWGIGSFLGLESRLIPAGWAIVLTVVISAVVESLPLHVDDNLTIPLTGAFVLVALTAIRAVPDLSISFTEWIWLLVNAILALFGYFLRTVTISGMIGGWFLGAILIVFAGWPMYVVLLTFFVIGSAATKVGYREKAKLDIAQERGGRRGFAHAFANVGVAAILSLLIAGAAGDPAILWVAAVASLATATADTTGSELGPLIGKRAFLPVSLRPVPPGTEGAISVEGTMAGAATALVVSFVGVLMLGVKTAHDSLHPMIDVSALNWGVIWHAVGVATVAAVAGSYMESITGSWNRKRAVKVPNGALNFFNTLLGALIAIGIFAARVSRHAAP